jgi:hypothetical protein
VWTPLHPAPHIHPGFSWHRTHRAHRSELKAGVQIGNIVHNDIVCTRNEDNSPVVSSYKTDELRNTEGNPEKLYNHVRPLIPQRPGNDAQLAHVLRCGARRGARGSRTSSTCWMLVTTTPAVGQRRAPKWPAAGPTF